MLGSTRIFGPWEVEARGGSLLAQQPSSGIFKDFGSNSTKIPWLPILPAFPVLRGWFPFWQFPAGMGPAPRASMASPRYPGPLTGGWMARCNLWDKDFLGLADT